MGEGQLQAPFSPGGATAIDAALARRLLELALSAGGDYADLYFEFRVGADYVSRTSRSRRSAAASRSASACASPRATRPATRTARISRGRRWPTRRAPRRRSRVGQSPRAGRRRARCDHDAELLRGADAVAGDAGAGQARAAAPRRRAARAFDPRIVKVEASFAEEIKEVLAVHLRRPAGARPPAAACASACTPVAEDRRQAPGAARAAAAAATAWSTSTTRSAARRTAREAARVAIAMLDAVDAPAGEMPVVLGPGDSGILLHEAVGHGLEADFNRKETSNYSGQIGKQVASPLCTVVDDGTIAHDRAARSTSTTRATPARRTC